MQKLKSQKLDVLEWILNKKTHFQSSQIFRLFYIIMVTTNYTFPKIFRLLPSSVASIILSHIVISHITYIVICIYIYIYIYIYANLPVNVVVKLSHPQSGDSQGQKTFLAPSANKQTHNYDTECSNHHLPYQS